MTPVLALAALATLTGCKPVVEEQALGGWLAADQPIRVDVHSSTGPAPHNGLARAVNEFGASLASGPMSVDVDGTPTQISFDAWGYGDVPVPNVGAADVWSGDQNAKVTAVDSDWRGFGLMPALESFGDAIHLRPATGGMLVSTLHEVYWVPMEGTAHRVLEFPLVEIGGMRSAHLDGDGVLDAVVWAGDTVAFLRGRPGGGMSWGGGVQLQGRIAGGVVADDVTGDDNIDVTIAWGSDIGEHALQIWEGDGLFGFDDWLPVDLLEPPTGLAVGDNTGDGSKQFTVMLERSVNWQRLMVTNGNVLGTGPTLDSLGMEPGSDVFSGADLNGDGGDELFLFSPLVAGTDRTVRIYDLVGNAIQFVPVAYAEAQLTIADGDNDGLVDLFALTNEVSGDRKLMHLRWNVSEYSQRRAADLTDHGPISFTDLDGDTVVDLALGGNTWTIWPGAINETESGNWWSTAAPAWAARDEGLLGHIAQGDTDNDPDTVEFVGMKIEAGEAVLKAFEIKTGEPPVLQEVRSTTLSLQAADGVDVAVCGTIAYALTETHLSRVNLVNGNRTRRIETTGTRVDCGDGPSGSVAALLDGDTVRLLDDTLNEVATESAGGAEDVALGMLGGVARVRTCSIPGCSIVGWDYGDDSVFATGSDEGLSIESGDGTTTLGGPGGELSVWDVDGDGTKDLISVGEQTTIGVYLSAGNGYGVGRFFHSRNTYDGHVVVGDVTGDGEADLLIGDGAGAVYQTLGLDAVPADPDTDTDTGP